MTSRTNEKYSNAFGDWVRKGNRLLKIGDACFLLIDIDQSDDTIFVYECDNVHTYKGWIKKQEFGMMILKKTMRLPMDLGLRHVALYDFVINLIWMDSQHDIDNNTYFSFDQIDTEQLPGWIVEELVIQKLSK